MAQTYHTVGDINGSFEKLKSELRVIKYPLLSKDFSVDSFQDGQPILFLPIIHYILMGYSQAVATFVSDSGFELYAKNDKSFIESVYKLMLGQFKYKPSITTEQFFQTGYAERKIQLCTDMCVLIKQKHSELTRQVGKGSAVKKINNKPAGIPYSPPSVDQSREESKQGMVKVIKHEPSITQQPPLPNLAQQSYPVQLDSPPESPRILKPTSPPQPTYNIQPQQRAYQPSYQEAPQHFQQPSQQLQYPTPQYPQQQFPPQVPSQQVDNNRELMALMVSLNESVRTLAGRFDTFQRSVDERLTRISNEQLLMKSKVEFLEKNCLPKADTSHITNQAALQYQQQISLVNRYITYIIELVKIVIYCNAVYDIQYQQYTHNENKENRNNFNAGASGMYSTNVFESGKLLGQTIQQQQDNGDTDEYIKRVQQRFEDAKRIMSEANLFHKFHTDVRSNTAELTICCSGQARTFGNERPDCLLGLPSDVHIPLALLADHLGNNLAPFCFQLNLYFGYCRQYSRHLFQSQSWTRLSGSTIRSQLYPYLSIPNSLLIITHISHHLLTLSHPNPFVSFRKKANSSSRK